MSRYAESDDGGTLVPVVAVLLQLPLIVRMSRRAQHFV
jgi:hypothetical protein